MQVVVFGATGMVGRGTLLEALDHPDVTQVLSVGRRTVGIEHPKLTEIEHLDFTDFEPMADKFSNCDACLWCLGTSSAGMDEASYTRVTYDFTMAAAKALHAANPNMQFCFLSGSGADDSEQGRVMWARVKGKTENELLQLPFKAAYMFRPAYIQPLYGIRSRTRAYRVLYGLVGPLFPVLQSLFPRYVTTTEKVGSAMIHVARQGYSQPVVENDAINALAARSR